MLEDIAPVLGRRPLPENIPPNFKMHPTGVCSWSLHPADIGDLVRKLADLRLSLVHLAFVPLLNADDATLAATRDALRDAGVMVVAGMLSFVGENYASLESIRATAGIVPDDTWPARAALFAKAARVCRAFEVHALSTHLGFLPRADAAAYSTILDRVRQLADMLGGHSTSLLFETGQESAGHLATFLNDVARANVGVNFDPANFILYGTGDPIAALHALGPYVRHVHLKDAVASPAPGVTWGKELPFGDGAVGPRRLLRTLADVGYNGPFTIECEMGQGMTNVRRAVEVVRTVIG